MIEKLFSYDGWDEVDGPMSIQIYKAQALRNFGKFQVGKVYSCVAFMLDECVVECYDDDGALLFSQSVELAAV